MEVLGNLQQGQTLLARGLPPKTDIALQPKLELTVPERSEQRFIYINFVKATQRFPAQTIGRVEEELPKSALTSAEAGIIHNPKSVVSQVYERLDLTVHMRTLHIYSYSLSEHYLAEHLALIKLLPPIPHMLRNDLRRPPRTMLSPYSLHKIPLRIYNQSTSQQTPPLHPCSQTNKQKQPTHKIKVDTMIHQIILPRLHIRRRREINPISLANRLDLLPRPRQAHQIGMKLLQVLLRHRRRVARRIARDEDRPQHVAARVFHQVDHLRHLVQLFWADVRAVREAEVDLQT